MLKVLLIAMVVGSALVLFCGWRMGKLREKYEGMLSEAERIRREYGE